MLIGYFLWIDIKERLAKQRQILNSRLGLDVASKTGMDLSELFTNEDLVINYSADIKDVKKEEMTVNKKSIREVMNEQELMMGNLSSREMNRARRKARQVNKQRSRDPCDENGLDEPTAKKLKTEDIKIKEEYSVLGIENYLFLK